MKVDMAGSARKPGPRARPNAQKSTRKAAARRRLKSPRRRPAVDGQAVGAACTATQESVDWGTVGLPLGKACV